MPNEKTLRFVEYLKQVASLRSKLVRDINEYEKVLWLGEVPRERGCFTQAWGADEEHEADQWLEVQSRREPELPAVPDECGDWVKQPTLRNKTERPALHRQVTMQIQNPDWQEGSDEPDMIAQTVRLNDHPDIQRVWDRYIEDKWLPWTTAHSSWEKVQNIYSLLFAIRQSQMRLGEEYELVLGLGLLTWQTSTGQRVRRHMMVANAAMEFDATAGKFTIRPNDDGAHLRPELNMLDIADQPHQAEEEAKGALVAAEDDPWRKGCVESVLQGLAHSLGSEGAYDKSLAPNGLRDSTRPVVEYAPALILRKRSGKGLTDALDKIKMQIESGRAIPSQFAGIAEIASKDDDTLPEVPGEGYATFNGETFFPKPSNNEQRRIVDAIRTAKGVLVQGPPGTGKSHTIANLISHLLATGKRILITAKTPRALRVLEELVPEEVRPLCINLLGGGLEERRSLETSVGSMLRKNDIWNEEQARIRRDKIETHVKQLREERTRIDRRLRDIREAETHDQSIAEGTYQGTAAKIAQAVNRDRSGYGWFADAVPLNAACQISTEDLQDILIGLRQFSSAKRQELALCWPESLPSVEHVAQLVKNEGRAAENKHIAAREADEQLADLLAKSDPAMIEAIRHAFSTFRDNRRKLAEMPYSWMNDAMRDILGGNPSLWRELLKVTQDVVASIEEHVSAADETRIDLPDETDVGRLYEDVRFLKDHLNSGGKLGWGIFRPKAVKERLYVIKTIEVNGRSCGTVDDFSMLADALQVRIGCEKAWNFWKGRSDKAPGPYALQVPSLKSLRDALEQALSLEALRASCREAIKSCSTVAEPLWSDEAQVAQFVASCHLALAHIHKQRATQAIQQVEAPLTQMAAGNNAHPVTHELLIALHNRDVDAFATQMATTKDLEQQRQQLRKLDEDVAGLGRLLPQFTESLKRSCDKPYWEQRIQHIANVWYWAQARCWIEDYIRGDDVPALANRIKQIDDEIYMSIAELASLYAWSSCFSRLNDNHRSHMEAWQQSIRRLGKGTGKYAAHNRRKAQEHLDQCRQAVPAWVMPLHRIWDTVSPEPEMFDVIIIDEASQCGLEALPLFYLGKQMLIVGDDKQISPDAVGMDRSSVHQLMDKYLYDFEFKSTFDIESSLFDHGKLRFGTRRITLREHFRCMPEIIRFSNDLCYADTPLIPLRQYGQDRLIPLEHVFVGGGYREGSGNGVINRPEADAIVERIIAMCGDSRYDGKTMGVVVLQGGAQAELIESKLLKRLGSEEMEQRRLICGNPYSFQGDERHIILLSLVAAANAQIGSLTKEADQRRFNVAASRARDIMILFHSVTADDLGVNCLRRQLLEFFENTQPQQINGVDRNELERRAAQDNRSIIKPPNPFDSWFEVDVALELLRKGYIVLAQYAVAGKRIDLVVEGGQARLAVECDGDVWHGAELYDQDAQRQRQLERCGWEFFRIRESAFYACKSKAIEQLWHMLDERNIRPASPRQTSILQAQ